MEKLQQTLQRAETLPEVEAEQAPRAAALSMVPLWVPRGGLGVEGRRGHAESLFPCCPTATLPVLQSTQEPGRGGRAAPLRWERCLSVRQPPLLCRPSVNFPPVVFCVSPGRFSSESLLLKSSVSHSKPSRIET